VDNLCPSFIFLIIIHTIMEQKKTFVLKNKKTFKRSLNIYVVNSLGQQEKRNIVFSTERLVDPKLRATNARTIAAVYEAQNDAEVNAILTNSAYGITYVRKDDPDGNLKLPTRFISTEDAEKAGLKSLFDDIGLVFNPDLPIGALKSMYDNRVRALAGANKIVESPVKSIPANKVDFAKERAEGIQAAKAKFEEKYGYSVPDIVADDLAFYDGLSNPDFPAEEYIASKQKKEVEGENDIPDEKVEKEPTIEELRKQYFDLHGANVANVKKNDATWIKNEIAKKLASK
jgi:hypothetical protein